MPLSADNFVHENTGTTAAGTSHVVSLAGADSTAAGNTVVVAFSIGGASITAPAGFLLAKDHVSTAQVFVKSDVPAGESSWTFTAAASVASAWYVAEVSGVDVVEPVDATAGVTAGAPVTNGGTASSGTTPLNAGLSTVALAVFASQSTGTQSWSGYTSGFEEAADLVGNSRHLAVARKFTDGATGMFETTGTLATTGAGNTVHAVMVVLKAAGSPVVAPLAHLLGFEPGTHGGATATNGALGLFGGWLTPTGTWGTNYLVQASSARNSSYGLRVVQTGAAAFVRAGDLNSLVPKAASFGFNHRTVSASGTVVVAEVVSGGLAALAQVLYDSPATRFGVRCGTTGTTQWQAGTTALNTFVWIDLRVKVNTSAWRAEWRIETAADTYTDQAAAELTGQSVNEHITTLNLGGNAAQTMTADYDDVVISRYYTAFPLGPHQVRLLTVDPAGTPSVSGTTTNFSTFASNGTLTAWNATTARNAVDEVPPTISASADGIAQTVTAASDYVQLPMATYTCGPAEFINGVRMLAAIGSGAGAGSGDVAIRGWDGTTETALASVSQLAPGSPTAISATVPLWRCAMWQSTNGWTQTELDAAATRFGFSGDATPDMWLHAIYLEVAIGKTRQQTLFGDMATAEVDPTRLGKVSVTVDAPVTGTGGTTLEYETGGSPITVPVAEGTTETEQINAVFDADASRITLYWPPEPAPES